MQSSPAVALDSARFRMNAGVRCRGIIALVKPGKTVMTYRSAIHRRRAAFAVLLAAAVVPITARSVHAGSATWLAVPTSGTWNLAANWSASGPPNGAADVATFATTGTPEISLSAATLVSGITFNAGASAYTITATPTFKLSLGGAGVTNSSAVAQKFVAAPSAASTASIAFSNSAAAGANTSYAASPAVGFSSPGGTIDFLNTSSAGGGAFTTTGSNFDSGIGGAVQFKNSSTAATASITNNGGAINAPMATCRRR